MANSIQDEIQEFTNAVTALEQTVHEKTDKIAEWEVNGPTPKINQTGSVGTSALRWLNGFSVNFDVTNLKAANGVFDEDVISQGEFKTTGGGFRIEGLTSDTSKRFVAINAEGRADFGTHNGASVIWVNGGASYGFSVNADQNARIYGRLGINTAASTSYQMALDTAIGGINVYTSSETDVISRTAAMNAAYVGTGMVQDITRASAPDFNHMLLRSSAGADTDVKIDGNGDAYADGAWNGGGADYAEFFEWADGNPESEDRRGWSVVLVGNQIRQAEEGETPFGVISANPSVVGDAAWNKWEGKYLTDDFGTYLKEEYQVVAWTETRMVPEGNDEGAERQEKIELSYSVDSVPQGVVVPDDAKYTTQTRRILNPDYDPNLQYVPRSERKEWDCVGMMGKLRLLKGQEVNPNWIKMRDISATVEEWLVR